MESKSIALVDDHVLLRSGLAGMLKESGYTVLFEADNGKDFIENLKKGIGAGYCAARYQYAGDGWLCHCSLDQIHLP